MRLSRNESDLTGVRFEPRTFCSQDDRVITQPTPSKVLITSLEEDTQSVPFAFGIITELLLITQSDYYYNNN